MTSAAPAALIQTIPQELSDFTREPRTYILASAWPDPLDVKFTGTIVTLPGDNHFDPAGRSGRFADGSPVPASRTLTDAFGFNEVTGEEGYTFNAKSAIEHILGLTKGSDGRMVCLSSWAQKGVFYVPKGCTQAQFQTLLEGARERSRAAEVRYAYEAVAAHDAANAKRRLGGDNALPGGAEIDRARRIIERANALRGVAAETERLDAQAVAESSESSIEFTAHLHAVALQLAEKTAAQTGVDKAKLFEMLIRDPEVKAYARKRKIHVRVNGYLQGEIPGEERAADADVIQGAMAAMEREEEERLASAPAAPEGFEPAGEVLPAAAAPATSAGLPQAKAPGKEPTK